MVREKGVHVHFVISSGIGYGLILGGEIFLLNNPISFWGVTIFFFYPVPVVANEDEEGSPEEDEEEVNGNVVNVIEKTTRGKAEISA